MNDQRKDQWIQQYEEAALGLLMEEYAEAEGAHLLQEFDAASQQGTVAPMPQDLDARCQKIIDQAYGKSHRRKLFSRIAPAVGKVAVVVLMLFGLVSVSVFSVDAWRIPVMNFLLDESGSFANLSFGPTDSQTEPQCTDIADRIAGFIPAGYALTHGTTEDDGGIALRYENQDNHKILIDVVPSSAYMSVDTENGECTELELLGHPAILIQKGSFHIIWCDEAEGLVYSVYADGLSQDAFWTFVYDLAE